MGINRRRPRTARGVAALTALVACAAAGTLPAEVSGVTGAAYFTDLASRADGAGAGGDAPSTTPTISADGCRVAFASDADNFSDIDGKGTDVFVRDMCANPQRTILVDRASASKGGGAANRDSWDPAISPDGRYVAFTSTASNIVTGDDGSDADVYLRDLVAETTDLVSSADANGDAGEATVSDGGASVAFSSDAPAASLVDGAVDGNGSSDVFVRDTASGATTLVSRTSAATPTAANGSSGAASISSEGTKIAFGSAASNLDGGEPATLDVFVRDRGAGVTSLVSRADGSEGAAATADSTEPAISANGGIVGFTTSAALVPADVDSAPDVYTRDLVQAGTKLASLGSDGSGAGESVPASQPSLSADGTMVAFSSTGQELAGAPQTACRTSSSETWSTRRRCSPAAPPVSSPQAVTGTRASRRSPAAEASSPSPRPPTTSAPMTPPG